MPPTVWGLGTLDSWLVTVSGGLGGAAQLEEVCAGGELCV